MNILTLKSDSDFAKRVEKVFEAMEENGVRIDFLAGEFRFSDEKSDNQKLQNMPLINAELTEEIQSLPPFEEWKLKVFNSEH